MVKSLRALLAMAVVLLGLASAAVAPTTLAAVGAAATTTVPLLGPAWNHTAITYAVQSSKGVTPAAVAAVQQAIANWNTAIDQSPSTRLHDFQLVPAPAGQTPDIQIRLKVGTGMVLGSTQFFARSDGSFAQAKVTLSGKAFGSALDADAITTISVHELGHALGLGHADNASDPMYAYYNGVKLTPSSCDVTAFAAVEDWYVSGSTTFYPPTVSSVSC